MSKLFKEEELAIDVLNDTPPPPKEKKKTPNTLHGSVGKSDFSVYVMFGIKQHHRGIRLHSHKLVSNLSGSQN